MRGSAATLDVALYSLDLADATAAVVTGALRAATARGVRVRLAYNVDHDRPIPVPPPPRTDVRTIADSGAEVRPIAGVPDLMHHKYAIRDGSALWTGSANWTDDSWTREENVIVEIESEGLARTYARDFEDVWTSGVAHSGSFSPDPVTVGASTVRAHFCPGRAERLAHRVAGAIARARRRVRIASPVITAGPVLGTLAEVAAAGRVDVAGVYDRTQMAEVIGQWRAEQHAAWKIPCFQSMVSRASFSSKVSTPWGPQTVHDFMHAKVCVADDVTFVGSYNFSHSGGSNAENVLEISDAELAGRLCTFIDGVRARYA